MRKKILHYKNSDFFSQFPTMVYSKVNALSMCGKRIFDDILHSTL